MHEYRSSKAMAWLLAACSVMLLPVASNSAAAAGDPAAGKQVFETTCSICHSAQQGRNSLGPSLFGVVGRPSATVAGYNYSPAFKALGTTWDEAALDKYIAGPRAMVPGTKMSYAGLKDDTKRANLIAYLATLK